MAYTQRYVSLDEIWPDLDRGLNSILTNLEEGFPLKEWMKLYAHVYDYCTKGARAPQKQNGSKSAGANFLGEELYYRVCHFLQNYTKRLLFLSEGRRSGELLVYYKKEWEQFTAATSKLHHIFAYLNRNWIKRESEEQKKGVYEIYTLSLVTWRDHLFQHTREPLKQALLDLIKKERNGEQIDTSLVAGVIKSFVMLSTASLGLNKEKPNDQTLDVYKNFFEDDFLTDTEIYYTAESSHFIMINTVADYMKKVETRLGEETRRVETYLHESTLGELITKCERVLIERHKETIQGEFPNLLEQDKVEDLTRMYSLLSRISGALDPLRANFEKYVHKVGMQAIDEVAKTAINDPKQYVDELLKVYKKYNALVVEPFKNDAGFVAALDKACRRFINDNQVCKLAKSPAKSPELLAKFTDIILKKTNKNQEEGELDELLNDVMVVFKYIEEKDVFMNVYSKLLAKRLIYTTYASEDLEGSMIGKLKSACGYEYTSKLQRMFTDLSLSRDLNEKFKNYTEEQQKDLGVDFSILVLATGSWPLQAPSTNFSIPRELQDCATAFQAFYGKQHTGRKLNWLHNLSKGELKMRYATTNKAGYTLQCSAYQMGVLLQFNQQDSLNTKELQVATQLADNVLINTLRTLLKTKVLNVEPKVADEKAPIEPTHTFTLNKLFKSPKGRMKVNINIRIEAEGEGGKKGADPDDPMPAVIEERKILIQAAVVRIMKARKKAKHANLVSEVVTQLQSRFKPQITLIKRCIDILIEKEYLERVENEKDTYSYIA